LISKEDETMQKIIIEDITDYEKLQAWVDTLDPKMKEEYEGKKEEN